MNVWPISAINQNGVGRCANCGREESISSHIIVSSSMYDGEWCCSKECAKEHDEKGCPFEYGTRYRDMQKEGEK